MPFHKHSNILHFPNFSISDLYIFTVLIQWFQFSPNIQFLQNPTVSLECCHEFIQKKIKSQEGKAIFHKKLFPSLEGRIQSTSRISSVIFTAE